MISELRATEFYRCEPMVQEQGPIEAKAIITGVNPGRVFVDDPHSPATGFVWLGNNDGFIFIGDETNKDFLSHLNHFIDTVIISEAKQVGLTAFEAIGYHPKWDAVLEQVLEYRQLKSWNQRVYTLQKEDYIKNAAPPTGYEIVKMNEALYREHAFLRAKIDEYWPTKERFFQEGIGYGVLFGNQMVSICFSGFVVDYIHCIDIETISEHQGKKLAQAVASAFVEDCLRQNLVPYWDCMESNTPSVAVAERLGFQNVFNYVGYYFLFE